MEMFIVAYEDYIYDELLNELVEICSLINEFVDDFFRRVLQIYYGFPKSGEHSGKEIFNWFSYLVSIFEECDMNDQAIFHSQNSDLVINDTGDVISNKHSDTTARESLSIILDHVSSECDPCNDPPSKNN